MKTKEPPTITKKQLVPYIKIVWSKMRKYLDAQRKTLGVRYNQKNIYEQITSRFGDPAFEPEIYYDEFFLCLNKASKQPCSVRKVIEDIGHNAVSLYLSDREKRLQRRREKRQERKEQTEKAEEL